MTTRSIIDDAISAVRLYVEAFNKGDVKAMAAKFISSGSILDGLAPHLWLGPTAAEDWYRDVLVAGEYEGATDYFVTLGEPLHANLTGDCAYVVLPASMTFNTRTSSYTNWRDFYDDTSQARRRLAHSSLGVGQGHCDLT